MKKIPPQYHILFDSSSNLGPLISRWEINKFENCWYKRVRILEVLKHLFQNFLNLSTSQRDMSGPKSWDLFNNRLSWGEVELWPVGNKGFYLQGLACDGTVKKTQILPQVGWLTAPPITSSRVLKKASGGSRACGERGLRGAHAASPPPRTFLYHLILNKIPLYTTTLWQKPPTRPSAGWMRLPTCLRIFFRFLFIKILVQCAYMFVCMASDTWISFHAGWF